MPFPFVPVCLVGESQSGSLSYARMRPLCLRRLPGSSLIVLCDLSMETLLPVVPEAHGAFSWLGSCRYKGRQTQMTSSRLLRRVTLDTPMNRKSMPEADFSSWTPLEFLVE